jgi:hypothetical protein
MDIAIAAMPNIIKFEIASTSRTTRYYRLSWYYSVIGYELTGKWEDYRSMGIWIRSWLSKTNEETISSPRGNTWGYEEIVSLLEVWAEDTIQRQQKIESIRDRIRWAVWTVVISRSLRDRFQCSHQRKIDRNRSNLRPII